MPLNSKFKQQVWLSFNADYVFNKLLDGKKFTPIKSVLWSALGAWVISPDDTKLRQDIIRIKINEIIGEFEKNIINNSNPEDVFDDHLYMVNENLKAGFYKNVYYPIGGLAAFSFGTQIDDYFSMLKSDHRIHVNGIIKVLEFLHYHKIKLVNREKYKNPSLKVCREAINKSHDSNSKYNKYTSIQSKLRSRGKTAHLCYSASKIMISGCNNETFSLLDSFFDNTKNYEFSVSYLKNWLGYAKFISEDLISPLNSVHLSCIKEIGFPDIQAKILETPKLKAQEEGCLLIAAQIKKNKRQQNSKPFKNTGL